MRCEGCIVEVKRNCLRVLLSGFLVKSEGSNFEKKRNVYVFCCPGF